MWICVKCGEEHNSDSHKYCWHCGYRNINAVITREESIEVTRRGVPKFASIEELAPEPPKQEESLKEKLGGGLADVIIGAILTAVVVPILRSVFRGYGIYFSVAFIILIVGIIFWRVFHRDSSEGKGLGLGS
jgi:hypothetical protein